MAGAHELRENHVLIIKEQAAEVARKGVGLLFLAVIFGTGNL